LLQPSSSESGACWLHLSRGVNRGRGVTLTTHPHLMPRSRMSSYNPSPPWRLHSGSGSALLFTFTITLIFNFLFVQSLTLFPNRHLRIARDNYARFCIPVNKSPCILHSKYFTSKTTKLELNCYWFLSAKPSL
jgi:hypothetical protein